MYMAEGMLIQGPESSPKLKADDSPNGKTKSDTSPNGKTKSDTSPNGKTKSEHSPKGTVVQTTSWSRAKKVYKHYLVRVDDRKITVLIEVFLFTTYFLNKTNALSDF